MEVTLSLIQIHAVKQSKTGQSQNGLAGRGPLGLNPGPRWPKRPSPAMCKQ